MKKVLITRRIPLEDAEWFMDKYQVTINDQDAPLPREDLLRAVKEYDGILTMLTDQIDQEVLEETTRTKIFANYAVGYNNFDLEYGKDKGIYFSNTPHVLTQATAELAIALMFSVARKLPQGDQYVRAGKFTEWKPDLLLGKPLGGSLLGIIGAGRIGQEVAKKAKGIGMEICYYNRHQDASFEKEVGARYLPLEALLKESDFVSIHTPLTATTRHLIGEKELLSMKKDAILINTARGPVVDEAALGRVLKSGHLFGAGLDVYEEEPRVHPDLLDLDRLTLLPHIGSGTRSARKAMAKLALEAIDAILSGQMPKNLVE